MSSIVPLLAHIGSPNNPWIGVVTIAAAAMVVILLLATFGAVKLAAPGDLLLPLAVVVLLAGLAGSLGDAINDQGPWAAPAGLVILGALVFAAVKGEVDLRPTKRWFIVTVVLAIAASLAVRPFLEDLWFPSNDAVFLYERGDASLSVELIEAPDETGTFTVALTVTGGTIGDSRSGTTPDDPELAMAARWEVGPFYLTPSISEACAADEACTTTEYTMTIPAGVTDVPETVTVELLARDGLPFNPALKATVQILPEG